MRERLVVTGLALVALAAVASCSDDVGPVEVTNFTATLSDANEVPDTVTATPTGTAFFSVVSAGILYRLDVTNVDSATAAHIHAPAAAGANAGVRAGLFSGNTPLAFTGTLAQGVVPAPTGMSYDSLLVLIRNGNAYVNVHTRTNPGGVMRGQIVPQ